MGGPDRTLEKVGRVHVLLELAHMALTATDMLAKCRFQITCSCSMEVEVGISVVSVAQNAQE